MSEKQKYLLFGDGASPHTLKWAKELVKYFDVYIISSQDFLPEFDGLIAKQNRFSLLVKVSKEKTNLGYFGKLKQIKNILKHIKPDFVNAHYISSHGLLIALLSVLNKPKYQFIASAWGTDVLVFPWRNKLFYYSMKFILSKADWVTSDSEYMSTVIKKIKNREVLTFTFGLNSLPEYEDTKKDKHLYFSNRMLTENYNIDRVIRVFSSIYQEDKKARLIISHQGDKKEMLQKLCNELKIEDAVEFVGFISENEQIEYYSRAYCYFSLPTSDSTSVSLLESLAYGCIPILSDIPANQEWVINQKNGLLIHDDISMDSLAQLKDNRSEIRNINRSLIQEKAIFPDLIHKFVKTILV